MTDAMKLVGAADETSSSSSSPNLLLLQAYLRGKTKIHPRRTLDQFFYHGLDTSARDRDQVVYRYCESQGQLIQRSLFQPCPYSHCPMIYILNHHKPNNMQMLTRSRASAKDLHGRPALAVRPQQRCVNSYNIRSSPRLTPSDLVVTCFPGRWEHQIRDPLNVLDGIMEEMNAKTRPAVRSAYDLAILISSRCSGSKSRRTPVVSSYLS
jgi:hypothetical protein